MSVLEVMRELEEAGTARQRSAYQKLGVTGPLFGASGAVHRAIARRIQRDQAFAEALWASGNFDARMVATLIARAAEMPGRMLSEWIGAASCPLLAEAVADVAALHPSARALAAGWRASSETWTAAVGWMVLTRLVPRAEEDELVQALGDVERRAPEAPREVRCAMSGTLVAIGARGDERLRTRAIETARRVGRRADGAGDDVPDAEAAILEAARARGRAQARDAGGIPGAASATGVSRRRTAAGAPRARVTPRSAATRDTTRSPR